jgi:DNA-binding MarR family transcriptional regulator
MDASGSSNGSGDELLLRLDSTPGYLLRRAQKVHTGLWIEQFANELTGPQHAVLTSLAPHRALDQRAVGERASLDRSTVTDVVARLERDGWVSRARDPDDGRRNLVSLTRAARVALRHTTPKVLEVQRRLLLPLAEHDRVDLVEDLAAVAYRGAATDDNGEVAVDPQHPETLQLGRVPGHLVRRAEQLHDQIWARLVGSSITPAQYGLLTAVGWWPAMDQGEAGDLASLDKANAAAIVERLSGRGLVSVVRDAHDRRRKLLDLTESGRVAVLAAAPAVADVQHALLSTLGPQEAQRLVRNLRAIAFR